MLLVTYKAAGTASVLALGMWWVRDCTDLYAVTTDGFVGFHSIFKRLTVW
jgi:hypothetical protein